MKACILCAHLELDESTGGEYAEAAQFSCKKVHFYIGDYQGLEALREAWKQADTCPHYRHHAAEEAAE